MDWDKASVELSKKLEPSHVKPAKQFGPKGDYLEGWFCMAEANRIFGFGEWSYSVVECKSVMQAERPIGKDKKPGWGVTYVATVRVDVDKVTREDVGAGHGYDVDLGLAHESAIKEAVTDALKRALRGFGNPFGLALYDKSRENVGMNAPTADAGKANRQESGDDQTARAVEYINGAESLAELKQRYENLPEAMMDNAAVIEAVNARKGQLKNERAAA